jgi:hypothetical protein
MSPARHTTAKQNSIFIGSRHHHQVPNAICRCCKAAIPVCSTVSEHFRTSVAQCTPVAALHDLLAPGELELGAAHCLLGLNFRKRELWAVQYFTTGKVVAAMTCTCLGQDVQAKRVGKAALYTNANLTDVCICMHAKQFSCKAAGKNTCRCDVRVLAADGQQDLPNGHARGSPQRLAKCAAHARLQVCIRKRSQSIKILRMALPSGSCQGQ